MTSTLAAPNVRVATSADRARIVVSLSRAFADDPALTFIFPDAADRAKRLPRFFGALFEADALAGLRLVTAGGEAATFWRGPGQARASPLRQLLRLLPLWRIFGAALSRAMTVGGAIDAHMPTEPFWYLHIAGCDPAAQGRGLGAAAVRAGLERIAGSGLPVYLETANERNLGFYGGLGFTVTDDWSVPGGGPRFWSLRRN